MWLLTIILSVVFSVFSTVVMSYLAMATPIGPWIAPTLALLGMLIVGFFVKSGSKKISIITLATCAGSVGGILATAFGFYFPTFYFLDRSLFNSWMDTPLYFAAALTGLALVAGWFGIWVANLLEDKFIVQEKLSFPIAQLVHKTIVAQSEMNKAFDLIIGFTGTMIFCFLQDGLWGFKGFIPKTVTLINPQTISIFKIPLVRFDIWPMLWALGFVTGHVIAMPLAVGMVAKVALVGPLNRLVFSSISAMEFTLTFSSGMVLFGAVIGFILTPKSLWKAFKNFIRKDKNRSDSQPKKKKSGIGVSSFVELFILLIPMVAFLSYFDFSFLGQLYLIVFTFICTYQIANIAGKIGLAFMGRYATFVMVPAMFIFNLDVVQITFIVVFVGVSGGVATDILFGRKLASLAQVERSKIKIYQYLGLIVSSVCVGVIFWLLIDHFSLGSQEIFAYRAQNRGLLITTLRNAQDFNMYVLFLGFLFGYILKKIKISPMLVLGGLFMPINVTLGLIVGGFGAFLTKNREEKFPFWSGVFSSNSIWMLIKAIV